MLPFEPERQLIQCGLPFYYIVHTFEFYNTVLTDLCESVLTRYGPNRPAADMEGNGRG